MNYTPFTDYQEIRIVSSTDGGVIYTSPYKAFITIEFISENPSGFNTVFVDAAGTSFRIAEGSSGVVGGGESFIGDCVVASGTNVRLDTTGNFLPTTLNIHVFRLN